MTEITTLDDPSVVTERTAAFFADPESATILLDETIGHLISKHRIQKALVDLSTPAGLTVATAFRDRDIPFLSLEYGQEPHAQGSPPPSGAEAIRDAAAAVHEIPISLIGEIDAEIVLIPKARGQYIDLAVDSVPGVVHTQCHDAGRAMMLILPPENGLAHVSGQDYIRGLVHVSDTADQSPPEEHQPADPDITV